ncbi:MAG: YebC/PmpR family DNA-binding transcriptional regulator [Bacteroidetes bacterium]|nr:MAG: YebC/PmpR family DNA-binding transcriptional regulator [Bacteroidota bacterium]
MAGHSKWANIKHRKGVVDARRSKLFTKLVKEIMVAVKVGGDNPDANPRLRLAIQNARGASVPKDNIERAINKASGNSDQLYLDLTYEAYGPFGVAIYIECTTDNQNRTVQNIKTYLNKAGGSLSTNGSLEFIFDQMAVFRIAVPKQDQSESLELGLIDAGAEDIEKSEENWTVLGQKTDFGHLQRFFQEQGLEPESAGLERIPKVSKELTREEAAQIVKLLDNLENDDDIKAIYHNLEYREEFEGLFE